MATLLKDIKVQSDLIVKAFGSYNLLLDYSIESFKRIDEFIDLHSSPGVATPGGRLSRDLVAILYSIGAYVGETIIQNVPGAVWRTDDKDPEGKVDVEIVMPDGTSHWPMQRVVRRFKKGAECGIYVYGVIVVKEIDGSRMD